MQSAKNTFTIDEIFSGRVRLGVLGGGQLGKMLAMAAGQWHLPIYVLDKHKSFPAGRYAAYFIEGDFAKSADVLSFGRQVNVLTIEIEHVAIDALHQLVEEGVIVHPAPDKLDIIKDKGRQKEFFFDHHLPTTSFELYDGPAAIEAALQTGALSYPFVQKCRTQGYDGRGVAIIKSVDDLDKLLPDASIVEEWSDIEKELAVIVARNERGEMKVYPTVEMVFHPDANMLDYLACPAQLDPDLYEKSQALAIAVAEAFDINGLLAIELFLNKSGELLVNEVAPRPHNSGHHTIEACVTSQFEQHVRGVLNLPLGSTHLRKPAVMINLLGEPGFHGPALYTGMEEVLKLPGVHIRLYGKSETKDFRKMGHANVIADTLDEALEKAMIVREKLRVIAY